MISTRLAWAILILAAAVWLVVAISYLGHE